MIKTICGYCAVGCKLVFDASKLKDDKEYPINEGKVCVKGISELASIHIQKQVASSAREKYLQLFLLLLKLW